MSDLERIALDLSDLAVVLVVIITIDDFYNNRSVTSNIKLQSAVVGFIVFIIL
jgi:hypothetical protein